MKRGEVWWVRFGPSIGGEIRKRRPAVVVTNEVTISPHGPTTGGTRCPSGTHFFRQVKQITGRRKRLPGAKFRQPRMLHHLSHVLQGEDLAPG